MGEHWKRLRAKRTVNVTFRDTDNYIIGNNKDTGKISFYCFFESNKMTIHFLNCLLNSGAGEKTVPYHPYWILQNPPKNTKSQENQRYR